MTRSGDFSAEEFVDELLEVGEKLPCDDTIDNLSDKEILPAFYDEKLFKQGQNFFKKHVFALMLSKFLGLLTTMSTSGSLQILVLTNMSNSDFKAYKRYMSTIFNMLIWYQEDFTPNSSLWRSLDYVKKRHDNASKKAKSQGLTTITQKEMAIAQFGFMGYAISRSKLIGIHNASDEELKAFVHVWRVIGYILGVQDRFNICRESVKETKEICDLLMQKVFQPELARKNTKYLQMASYLINGLWAMCPVITFDVFLSYMYLIIENKTPLDITSNTKSTYIDLNRRAWFTLNALYIYIYLLKFSFFRVLNNYIEHITFWLMRNCPFLAYYQFGRSNSKISVEFSKK